MSISAEGVNGTPPHMLVHLAVNFCLVRLLLLQAGKLIFCHFYLIGGYICSPDLTNGVRLELVFVGLLKPLYDKQAAIQHAVFRVVLPAVLAVKPNRFGL
jgi:hypothetical protein